MAERLFLIGSDARTHATVWKMRRDCPDAEILVTPGNAGITQIAECKAIPVTNLDALVELATNFRPTLSLVGPEGPLVDGIVDRFQAQNLRIFGPSKGAAKLEGSKIWSNDLMEKANIPHAKGKAFYEDQIGDALEFVNAVGPKESVIKADGLCGGKGVVLPDNMDEAAEAIVGMMSGERFGEAGTRILIQERLKGQEISVMAIVGSNDQYALLPVAKDNKRLRDPGIPGANPNTGGMGGFAPVEFPDERLLLRLISRSIMRPTLRAMRAKGVPYRGVLYAGLMLTDEGPKVLEFNVRSGDPETEVQLPLIESNLYETFESATSDGLLLPLKFRPGYTAGVVLATEGYPDKPKTGDIIYGLSKVRDENTHVFHGGTIAREDGQLETNGGRILEIVSYHPGSVDDAFARAYASIGLDGISFRGMQFRRNLMTAAA